MTGEYVQRIRPEWIDYNGHLSEPYYVLVFGYATDALMGRAGLDDEYRDRTGCSLYTVEAHVRYLREVGVGADVAVRTVVLEVGPKKIRFCHEMRLGTTLVATEELMALHVDQHAGRAVPFPDPAAALLRGLIGPAPDYAGRAIG